VTTILPSARSLARFPLAHGGRDGHPFPVPLEVYDETIRILKRAICNAKLVAAERVRSAG
jgi:hypothetical protein